MGHPLTFVDLGRGLKQGFSLAPFMFIFVAEGLSRLILGAKNKGSIKGLSVGGILHITHLFLLMAFISFPMDPDMKC